MNKLRKLRLAKGLTQKELADKIGVKHNEVSRWELGMNKFGIKNAIKLSIALECEITDLLELEEN